MKNADGLMTIRAFVVLNDGAKASPEILDALKQHCKKRLGPQKFPRTIQVVEDLPKTGQGKIDRRLLRERAL